MSNKENLKSKRPKSNLIKISRVLPHIKESLGLDAQLKINGNYLNYGSYTYQGDIVIDGAKKKIEELISAGLTCS